MSNYISKFAPNSYFFTAPGAIAQAPTQAFGPVDDDVFRLTSKFTMGSASMAYAICTGIALVQPQAGSATKVNLILRPFQQPIVGLNIKYFIYRGLNKSDFFSGSNLLPGTGTPSDLVKKANTDFTDFYHHHYPGQTVPDFLASYIGFDPAGQADTLLIDELFFKQVPVTEAGGTVTEDAAGAFELPLVQIGSSLGNFAAGSCGMDVVISYGDYKLPQPNDEFVFDLAYARAAEKLIDLSAETNAFKKKQTKEQIFQFLDIAAYYGFHSNDLGWVKTKQGTADITKKGEQIYTDLLQNFHTKNSLYLYIQSDRTRSYNFYGNYNIGEGPNCLMYGQTEAGMAARPYRDTLNWPLIVDKAPQSHTETTNKLYLQFVTDNNPNTVLYGQVARIENAESNNFCGPDNLRVPPDANGTPSTFTKTVILSTPAVSSGSDKVNIAGFNILIYQGEVYNYLASQVTNADGNTTDIFAELAFFDDIFGDLNSAPSLQSTNSSSFTSLCFSKINLINHYYNNTQYGISAVQTCIINDVIDTGDVNSPTVNRVTFMTDSVDVLNNATAINNTVTADTKSSSSTMGTVTGNKTYTLPNPFYYDLKLFTDGTQTITGIKLLSTDGTIPSKIILGLTKVENDLLKGLLTANNIINPRLVLIDLFEDSDDLISAENIIYQKYKAAIIGEDAEGELKLYQPTADVMVYSIDRKYHFTSGYSKYVKEDTLNQSKDLLLDARL
jgi:hypothetical protein